MIPTITRERTGETTVSTWLKKSNSEKTIDAAEYFLAAYAFLIKRGETVSVDQLIERVKTNYAMDVRRRAEAAALCLCTYGNLDLMAQFESFNENRTLVALNVDIRLYKYVSSLRRRNVSECKIAELYQAMTTDFTSETEGA